ncbi:MAG: hypothetical protein ACE5OZ_00850 [Candidatus Heimdallarchaeota archaeon]
MDVREVLSKGFVLIIDPTSKSTEAETGSTDANAFLAEHGGWIEEVAIVAKAETGQVTYKSAAAPTHPKAIFPDFVELANDLGIRVYAVVHCMADQYFGQDYQYTSLRSGGIEIRDFICPSQISYWKYLAAVSREVAKYPVTGILYMEFMYPRREFCFCKRCTREFGELTGIGSDFTFNDISREPEYFSRFVEWRSDIISAAYDEVFAAARSIREDIQLIPVVDVDPETGWSQGTREHFGYDVDMLLTKTPNLAYHLMPFSPIAPEPGTGSWGDLKNALQARIGLEGSYVKSLVVWGIIQEEEGSWILQLKEEAKADRVFARLSYPDNYNVKREIHRGIA